MRFLSPLLLLSCFALAPLGAQAQAPRVASGSGSQQSEDPAAELAREASANLEAGRFEKAAELFAEVARIRLAELGEGSELLARAHYNRAIALWRAEDLLQAMESALRSLELSLAISGGHKTEPIALEQQTLARLSEATGNLSLARGYAEQACEAFTEVYGRTPMVAAAHEYAGQLALRDGDLEAAQTSFQRALALNKPFGDAVEISAQMRPMLGLAAVLAARGNMDVALTLYLYVARMLEGQEAAAGEQDAALRGAFGLLEELGEHGRALDVLDRRLQPLLATVATADERISRHLIDPALGYLRLGRPRRALELADRFDLGTRPEAEGLPAHIAWATVRAEALLLLGHTEDALGITARTLLLFGEDEAGLASGQALGLRWLRARSLARLGRIEEARGELHALLDVNRSFMGADHPALIDTYLGLLELERELQGTSIETIDLLDMTEAALGNLRPQRWAALLARPHDVNGAPTIAVYAGALAELAAARPQRRAQAFGALERLRERTLVAPMAVSLERTATGAAAGALEDLAREERFGWGPEERDTLRGRLQAAAELSGSHWASMLAPKGASLDEARQLLGPKKERLLLFTWGEPSVHAWLVGPSAEDDVVVNLGGTSKLGALLATAQEALRTPEKTWQPQALSDALLGSLQGALASVERLWIIADGPLAYLPFEALAAPGHGDKLWTETCRIAYAPSVARLIRSGGEATRGTDVLHIRMNSAGIDPALSPLQRIREDFRVTAPDGPDRPVGRMLSENERLMDGLDARESQLMLASAAGQLSGLRLLDLDVIGYVDAVVPSRTGLLLTAEERGQGKAVWERENGFLDLSELARLNLDVDVALLSKTLTGPQPTASGLRADSVHTIVASLQDAGARRTILAGWASNDVRADNFERRLAGHLNGSAPGEALWEAQKEWLALDAQGGDVARLRHPAVWARLRMFGK